MGLSQKALLRAYGIRPVKRRGQNFLVDGNLARWIASRILELGREVLELGAGAGALTGPLLEGGAAVTAIEVDRKLCSLLRQEFGSHERFRLVEADLSECEWIATAPEPVPVVAGNIPYVLSSTVLFRLAELRERVAGAMVMVQKEVADRLTAHPGGPDYGVLAAILGAAFSIETIRRVPATVFWPRPDVASAVVMLEPRPAWPTVEWGPYVRTVKSLFQQRRKMVKTVLRSGWDLSASELNRVAGEAGIDPDCRPQQLTRRQLRSLSVVLERRNRS